MSADSLANTVLGGPSLNSASYRFQARHTSALKGIRVFFIWSLVKSGYQAGQGGTVQVSLMADDGTAAHLPTGPALATVTYGNIIAQNNNYPELTFPTPAVLTGGRFYHLVFTNVDPSPTANYISLDSLYTDAQTAPMQPSVSDTDFAELVRFGHRRLEGARGLHSHPRTGLRRRRQPGQRLHGSVVHQSQARLRQCPGAGDIQGERPQPHLQQDHGPAPAGGRHQPPDLAP